MKKFNSWINENKESKKDFVKRVREKYGHFVIPIDRERYTEIPGLEGPFGLRSGKVVYYDPKEGKYYDRDTDMYMSYDDYDAHANPRPRNEATMSQVVAGVRDDKKNLGPMAWQSLQQMYDLLKNLAQTNPQKLLYITRIIDKELKNDPKANTKGLMTGARRIVNKMK